MALGLHVADGWLDSGSAFELPFDGAEDAAFLSRDEDASRIIGIVAAVSLVGEGALDLAPGECLRLFEHDFKRVAVIRVARQRLGMEYKLPARRSGVGG